MVDVARLAGVSHQTVSRVLNGSPAVGPELTERVLNAVHLLAYKRNPAARTLATSRSLNLGVISFGISLYGPSVTLFGIAEAARQVGYTTSLVALGDYDRASVRGALDHLVEIAVDGVIAIAPVREAMEVIRSLLGELPFVAFEPGLADGITSVAVDEVLGARLATRHLLELGHATVWHVSGPPGWHGTEARIKGWQDELAIAKRVAHQVIVGDDWSAAAGYKAGKQIALNREISAVFVANDQMSLGILQALRDCGLSVPEDVSVVGFDDIPEAAYFQPALTTMRLDFDAVGRRCVAMLMDKIGVTTPGPFEVPFPQLVVRSSASAPRG
jgi:DNA-binding LacI/PurR family transcriptional regulator